MSIKDDYYVKQIFKEDAKDLIKTYHYLGDRGFRYKIAYGLFRKHNDTLIGCAVYHDVSAPETVVGCFGLERNKQDGVLELGRMVLLPEFNGKNFGSFLIGYSLRSLKLHGYKYAISYASSDMHHGYIYQATNWKYYGLTDEKKDFYILDGEKLIKQERGKTKGIDGAWLNRPRKHRYIYKLNGGLDILWVEKPYPTGNNDLVRSCLFCDKSKKVLTQEVELHIIAHVQTIKLMEIHIS